MSLKIRIDNEWVNKALGYKLTQWNQHAKIILQGMRDLDNSAIHAVWIRDELETMIRLYDSMTTLIEIGAQFEEKSTK